VDNRVESALNVELDTEELSNDPELPLLDPIDRETFRTNNGVAQRLCHPGENPCPTR
jgi:hypothetical protein